MLVDIISDFHVEFNGNFYKQLLKDSISKKIIIAGDMGPITMPEITQAFVWLCNKYEEVIYVAGNHCSYSGTLFNTDKVLLELEDYLPALTVLGPNRMTTIGNYKVIGDTLWVKDVPELRQHQINDPFQIKDLYFSLNEKNKKASEFIYKTCDSKTIVVTHHLPHSVCVAKQYINEPTNCWFVSDESKTFKDKKPYMWIYGHSHVRADFLIGNTRVINNAYGYRSESKFFKLLTLDI